MLPLEWVERGFEWTSLRSLHFITTTLSDSVCHVIQSLAATLEIVSLHFSRDCLPTFNFVVGTSYPRLHRFEFSGSAVALIEMLKAFQTAPLQTIDSTLFALPGEHPDIPQSLLTPFSTTLVSWTAHYPSVTRSKSATLPRAISRIKKANPQLVSSVTGMDSFRASRTGLKASVRGGVADVLQFAGRAADNYWAVGAEQTWLRLVKALEFVRVLQLLDEE